MKRDRRLRAAKAEIADSTAAEAETAGGMAEAVVAEDAAASAGAIEIGTVVATAGDIDRNSRIQLPMARLAGQAV